MSDIPTSLITDADSGLSPDFIEPYLSRSRSQLWLMVREGRRFILKGLPEELRNHPEEVARLRKEYSLGLRVNHPGVAGVYGFEWPEQTGPVIVMEYVDGTSLDEFIAENPSADQRYKIATRIADALTDIHSLGIAHRDIKPDNILVTRRRSEPKIIDFSLADGDDSVIYKTSLGTAEFGAPEQQQPTVSDSAADVYSFGRLLEILLPERRYRRVREACLADDPDSRPGIEQVAEHLAALGENRRKHTSAYLLVALIAVALCIAAMLFLPKYKELPDTQESPAAPVAPPPIHDTIYQIAPGNPSTQSMPGTQSIPSTPTPAKEPEQLKAILQKYIDEVDAAIARHGGIPYDGIPTDEINARRNARTKDTYDIAERAEKEMKESGAPAIEIDQMMYTYWWHVSSLLNEVDGVYEKSDSIMHR